MQAIAFNGTRAAMVLEDPIDGNRFAGFYAWLLAPSLSPGDLVGLDNLSSCQSVAASQAVEAVGTRFSDLPPYSPDLNPIEKRLFQVQAVDLRHSIPKLQKDCRSYREHLTHDHPG